MPRSNQSAYSTAVFGPVLTKKLDKPITHNSVVRGYTAADHDLGTRVTLAISPHRLPAAEVPGR